MSHLPLCSSVQRKPNPRGPCCLYLYSTELPIKCATAGTRELSAPIGSLRNCQCCKRFTEVGISSAPPVSRLCSTGLPATHRCSGGYGEPPRRLGLYEPRWCCQWLLMLQAILELPSAVHRQVSSNVRGDSRLHYPTARDSVNSRRQSKDGKLRGRVGAVLRWAQGGAFSI